ncbi:MAG TPA: hypothetical protein PLD47_08210 [Aggregatilineales bacterium]|nr:hypothetical protein [Anaerolineales bacterium]HRE47693.1 hypothetical protein [Aggregatilineales bacterium]
MTSKRKQQRWYQQQWLRLAGIIFLVIVLVLPAVLPNGGLTPPVVVPTLDPNDPLAGGEFPAVPEGGTPVTKAGLYVHPSGLYTLPKLVGWELTGKTPEERSFAADTYDAGRVGSMFSNGSTRSVYHAFVETDAANPITTTADMTKRFSERELATGWADYESWRETSRREDDTTLAINFDLVYEGQTYLARQLSKIARIGSVSWVMVLRIVVPNNNPALLERLEAMLYPNYTVWEQAMLAPPSWVTIKDSGYILRFPPTWQQVDGGIGRPYTITGSMDSQATTLTTNYTAGTILLGEDAAKTWLTNTLPRAEVLTLRPLERAGTAGFMLSFRLSDADGNPRSGAAILFNGRDGALYTAVLQRAGAGVDWLSADSMPPLAGQLLGTFVVLAGDPEINRAAPTPVTP